MRFGISTEENAYLNAIEEKIEFNEYDEDVTYTIQMFDWFKNKFGVVITEKDIDDDICEFYLDDVLIYVWDYSPNYNNTYRDLLDFINSLERSLKIKALLGDQNE